MSDPTYRKQYFSLIRKLQAAGLEHPRKVWWFCPSQWAKWRRPQIASMRAALESLTGAE